MKGQKIRCLKVLEIGDFHKRNTVPQIRLQGKWLVQAGIYPNSHVEISNPQPGVLMIIPRRGMEGGQSNQ